MIIPGLTGSIGMGKSTAAKMFAEAGVPVHDSDETVHLLYAGQAAPLIEAAFPGVVVDGVVDRAKLAARVLGDKAALKRLEEIVHPLVRAHADAFVASHRAAGTPLVVLDIPRLRATGGRDRVDNVAVVSAAPEIQREPVLSRPGMTPEKVEAILARQTPDAEKRRLADFVIDTGTEFEATHAQILAIIDRLIGDKGQQARP